MKTINFFPKTPLLGRGVVFLALLAALICPAANTKAMQNEFTTNAAHTTSMEHPALASRIDKPRAELDIPKPVGSPAHRGSKAETYLDYNVQPGDTLTSLAMRFNSSVSELRVVNPALSTEMTTLPPGTTLRVPNHDLPQDGQLPSILPDSLFVNGPAQVGFDVAEFVNSQPGWLKNYTGFSGNSNHSGCEIVLMAVRDYHVSPRLLLALLEYQSGALTKAEPSQQDLDFPMGYQNPRHKHLYNQVMLISHTLNNGYYSWRAGSPAVAQDAAGNVLALDPRQNAASVALQSLFFQLLPQDAYQAAIAADGFAATYAHLFGDAWANDVPHIPADLRQPDLHLPFEPGKVWALTGGPHTAWGDSGQPWAALDFAPPSLVFGCQTSYEWATAVAPGVVTRSENGLVALDLDGDGDERTGWVIYYFHVATKERVAAGARLGVGDYIGHPSCEGGRATGNHIHISRVYNGEWIIAYGTLAFNMEGWSAYRGEAAYQGGLKRQTEIVLANTNANDKTLIMSDARFASHAPSTFIPITR